MAGPFAANLFGQEHVAPHPHRLAEMLNGAILEELAVSLTSDIEFLMNPPAVRAYHNTTQSMANNTDTLVVFNSERYDTAGMHDTATNTSRITVNTAGLYLFNFHGRIADGTDYVRLAPWLRLNGSGVIGVGPRVYAAAAADGTNLWLAVSTVWKCAAADYIEAVVFQNNGASAARNLLSGASYSPEFSAIWLGNG